MITFPFTFSQARTLADGSLRITIDANIISTSGIAEILSYRNKMGYCAFKVNDLTDDDVSELNTKQPLDSYGKSKSQELRGAIYSDWKLNGGYGFENFTDYYNQQMDSFIRSYKRKWQV